MSTRKILLIVIAIITVVTIVLLIFGFIRTRTKPAEPSQPTTSSVAPPPGPIKYAIDNPALANNHLFFIADDALGFYDLQTQQDAPFEFPPLDSEFIVIKIVPLETVSDKVVIQLENLTDGKRQFAVFDLKQNLVLTKFVERMLAVTWLKDEQKLLGFAKSKEGEPFFLASSLDAKDQKPLAKTTDENVEPLSLVNNKLLYTAAIGGVKTIKQIDLSSNELTTLVDNIDKAIASPSGKTIAYSSAENLFILNSQSGQKSTVTSEIPAFFNWSSDRLLYGISGNQAITISQFDPATNQAAELAIIEYSEVVTSVEAAFQDELNNRLIYWSDGFLYSKELP